MDVPIPLGLVNRHGLIAGATGPARRRGRHRAARRLRRGILGMSGVEPLEGA